MQKTRKKDITTVNFGDPGNPARVIKDMYIKKNGKTSFSAFVRRLVVIYGSSDPMYDEYKNQILIVERAEIKKELATLMKRKYEIEEELKEKGIDPAEVDLL